MKESFSFDVSIIRNSNENSAMLKCAVLLLPYVFSILISKSIYENMFSYILFIIYKHINKYKYVGLL